MTSTRNWRRAVNLTQPFSRVHRRVVVGVLAATTVAVGLTAPPALGTPRTEEPLAGVQITCGAEVLTFTGGVQVGDLHRVQLGNGRQVVINDVVLHDATLTDEAGVEYRVVGSANSTSQVLTDDGISHFNVNLTVLGDNGRLGRLWLRERVSRDGTVTTISGGGCTF